MFEVREVLRLWLGGQAIRAIGRLTQLDRKTVDRYVDAAKALGLGRDGGEEQLTDEFIGGVVEAVRPHRIDGRGEAWRLLTAQHELIAGWVEDDLTAVKITELLERRGIVVPLRTMQRYVLEACGRCRGQGSTVRIADGELGDELQVDFGRMGLIFDPVSDRQRVAHALIFTDPARVRRPQDKPRVERTVQFVRGSFFAGETFVDLADAQRQAETWCRERAGMRVHGTTQQRPIEVFLAEEQPKLLPAPSEPYDLPRYATPKVHRDHHIEVARALYSVPGNLIGQRVEVRADSQLVRVFHRGVLVKVHPRQAPGRRVTDPEDLPSGKEVYALRDLDRLQRMAATHGAAIGAYASALLDTPLPWTKMRQVYALLGLVKKWGADRVDAACRQALEAEAINVGLIGRMLERGTEQVVLQPALPGTVIPGRFARDPEHFAVTRAGDLR